MFYQTERELQEELTSIDFNMGTSFSVSFMRREVPVGDCIPDLVLINFDEDPSSVLWPRKWNFRHSYVVWLLRNHDKLNVSEIAAHFYASVDKISPILHDLRLNDIIEEDENGFIRLSNKVGKISTQVIAIEAKLKNWREALVQAVKYKGFANIAFVAMDASAAPRSDTILNKFRDNEVGICAVSSGAIEWLVYPPTRSDGLGHQKEHLVMSASLPTTQTFWLSRKRLRASNHD